jgi:hypothetical protein
VKLCTVCGVVTSGGSRCPAHTHGSRRSHPNPLYRTPGWQRLSRRMLAAHVGAFGWVCPGDGPDHRAHPARSLTVDHIVPISAGGAPFDRANLRVLCRPRNSELGARTGNALRRAGVAQPGWGSPLAGFARHRPRPATVCARLGFAKNPAPLEQIRGADHYWVAIDRAAPPPIIRAERLLRRQARLGA